MILIRKKLRVLYASSNFHLVSASFYTALILRIFITEDFGKDFRSSFFGILFITSQVISLFISSMMLVYINYRKATYISAIFKLLELTDFLYSNKNQKDIFESIAADWQEEFFEALFKKEIWKARWINVRYTYAFLAAMWQKSPIGDLIEFISKIAKQ